jgi:hypothetical protein
MTQLLLCVDYAGLWIGVLAFDTSVFLMTVHKSISRWKEDELRQGTSITHILLRDGALFQSLLLHPSSHLFSLIGTVYFGYEHKWPINAQ